LVGVQLLEGLDPLALPELGAGCRGQAREAPDPAGRLKRPVPRVEDRPVVATVERLRQLVAPLRGEAVITQRLVLELELGAFAGVGGQAQAAVTAEGVPPSSASRSR
jgi:hypothetical protein